MSVSSRAVVADGCLDVGIGVCRDSEGLRCDIAMACELLLSPRYAIVVAAVSGEFGGCGSRVCVGRRWLLR